MIRLQANQLFAQLDALMAPVIRHAQMNALRRETSNVQEMAIKNAEIMMALMDALSGALFIPAKQDIPAQRGSV